MQTTMLSLPCSFWPGTPPPPSFPMLQTCFSRGKWFCGLSSPAPRRSPKVFAFVTREWPWDTLHLWNTFTKEIKLLWISPPIQKQHPRHANRAKIFTSRCELEHLWICNCYCTGIPNHSVQAANNHIFRPRHPKPSWALQINYPAISSLLHTRKPATVFTLSTYIKLAGTGASGDNSGAARRANKESS